MTEQITATAPQARYIDVADAAKMLRPFLRNAFPGVKFSVRIDRYSMGASINVSWTDGPTVDSVEKVTNGFRGGRFEGMTDCAYSADSWYCKKHGARSAQTYGCDLAANNRITESRCCADAELVHFSATSLCTSRELSAEFRAELATIVREKCGMPTAGRDDDALPVGSLFSFGQWDTVGDGIYRLSRETTR